MMLREAKVQKARWHQGGAPLQWGVPHTSASISLKIWEGTGKKEKKRKTT